MIIEKLKKKEANFTDVLAHIEDMYHYTPSAFTNGNQENAADQNQGSAKVFAFAQINHFSKEETLLLFVEHYETVLATPTATDHQNIRQFMQNGWEKVVFKNNVLTKK